VFGGAGAAAAAAVGGGNGHVHEVHCMSELVVDNIVYLVSGALDGSIKAWRLDNPDAPHLLLDLPAGGDRRKLLSMSCMSLVVEETGADMNLPLIICGYDDGTVTLRDPRSNLAPVANLNGGRNGGHTRDVRAVCPGPSNVFFTGGSDGKFFAWKWYEQ
jgi:WD40 repeat protein